MTFIFLTLLSTILYSQERIGKKEHISFKTTEYARLSIDNKFGNIDIRNWDKKEVDVTVEVKLFDISEDKAKELLEMIELKHYAKAESGKAGKIRVSR